MNFSRSALLYSRARLKHPVNHCPWKEPPIPNSPQTLQSSIRLTAFATLRPLTQFEYKIRAKSAICKKALKYAFFDNYYPKLFTEIQIWY